VYDYVSIREEVLVTTEEYYNAQASLVQLALEELVE
jgi:hypothetical protein